MTRFGRYCAALIAALIILTNCLAAGAETPESYDMSAPQNLQAGHLYAESALLVDMDSGEVLFSKNSRVRMYPASTTKIMTLLLALESDIPLGARVTIPAEAADIPEGSSVIPVKPGDVMSFEDLLCGFMLSSGNDGANAIAVLVGGSIESFVSRMNERARALGCEGTHYVNAHGYHTSEHYTTAQDLAVISREAMKNADFRRIVAEPTWTMAITRDGGAVETKIVSRNSLLQSGEKYYYPDCTGIKTGHHGKAGWCFVGSAERDGMRVICVVLNCAQENDKWYDAARLFEYGFTRYTDVTAAELLNRIKAGFDHVSVAGAAQDDPQGGELALALSQVVGGEQTVKVVSGSDAALNAATDRFAESVSIEWTRPLEAPIAAGEILARLTCALPGGEQVSAQLVAARDIAAQPAASEVPQQVTTVPEQITQSQQEQGQVPAPVGRKKSGTLVFALIGILLVAAVAAIIAVREANRRARARKRAARHRAWAMNGRPAPSTARRQTGTRKR
ncbi:MAG: D-alanyl-D-alanine carboxypeptidase family protein [Clostridia bacterium]|nr:D-alanyl-D-alanine carboxypeptidase family protein [Clostridia bacterium]